MVSFGGPNFFWSRGHNTFVFPPLRFFWFLLVPPLRVGWGGGGGKQGDAGSPFLQSFLGGPKIPNPPGPPPWGPVGRRGEPLGRGIIFHYFSHNFVFVPPWYSPTFGGNCVMATSPNHLAFLTEANNNVLCTRPHLEFLFFFQ